MFSQEGRRRSTTDPIHGHAQANPDTSEIGDQHPEDHAIYENGVRGQVRARRTRAASGPSLRRRCLSKSYAHFRSTTEHSVTNRLVVLPQAFYEKSGATEGASPTDDNKMVVAISSDRGLCGAVHTNVAKMIRNQLKEETPESNQTKIFCVGDKSRALLQRYNISLLINTKIGFYNVLQKFQK